MEHLLKLRSEFYADNVSSFTNRQFEIIAISPAQGFYILVWHNEFDTIFSICICSTVS